MHKDNLNEIVKPSEIDPALLQRIQKRFGKVDMENDFFDDELSKYYKTTFIDSETGRIEHTIYNLASFGDSLKELSQALDALVALSKTSEGKTDNEIQDITQKIRDVFNRFRTHLRNNYPDQYNTIKDLIDEISITGGGAGAASFSPGTGMQYATPFAFNKNKKAKGSASKYYYKLGYKLVKEMSNPGSSLGPGPKAGPEGVKDNYYVKGFKYKLVPKKIKGSGLEVKQLFQEAAQSTDEFQQERIAAFDKIEQELNSVYSMLSNAKNETAEYYNVNPGSYGVVTPTDLILDYIKDIKTLLQGE